MSLKEKAKVEFHSPIKRIESSPEKRIWMTGVRSPSIQYVLCYETGLLKKIDDPTRGKSPIFSSSFFEKGESSFMIAEKVKEQKRGVKRQCEVLNADVCKKRLVAAPNGKYIVYVGFDPSTLRCSVNFLVLATGKQYCICTSSKLVTSICITPDSKYIVLGNERGDVERWDMNLNRVEEQIFNLEGPVNALTTFFDVTGDSQSKSLWVAACRGHHVYLWDMDEPENEMTFSSDISSIQNIAISKDRNYFMLGGDVPSSPTSRKQTFEMWNLCQGRVIAKSSQCNYEKVAFIPSASDTMGTLISERDDETGKNHSIFRLLNVKDGKSLLKIKFFNTCKDAKTVNQVSDFAFSPCGRYVAFAETLCISVFNISFNKVQKKHVPEWIYSYEPLKQKGFFAKMNPFSTLDSDHIHHTLESFVSVDITHDGLIVASTTKKIHFFDLFTITQK